VSALVRHDPPLGYPVCSYCCCCGRDFSCDRLFERHRVGRHVYTFPEGLRLDPPRDDGRRCLDDDELRALGWRPMTDAELGATVRHRWRAGFGVSVWFDTSRGEDVVARMARKRAGSREERQRGAGEATASA
jgi:hypothetical protein